MKPKWLEDAIRAGNPPAWYVADEPAEVDEAEAARIAALPYSVESTRARFSPEAARADGAARRHERKAAANRHRIENNRRRTP